MTQPPGSVVFRPAGLVSGPFESHKVSFVRNQDVSCNHRRVAEETAASPVPPAPSREEPEPARILVVDDNPQTLRFVRDALSAAGYAPLVTGEPAQLARFVRNEKPRLVRLDLMLRGTDGIELMVQVPELSDLPIVFICGYGRDETIARALEPAPTTTSSSPCRRRSWSHGSGRRCEGARHPNRSCWASSPSTMGRAG